MKKLAICVLATSTLAGCMTTEQVARRDDDYCQSIGFTKGTQGYAQCRLMRTQAEDIADENRRSRMMALGLSMMNR